MSLLWLLSLYFNQRFEDESLFHCGSCCHALVPQPPQHLLVWIVICVFACMHLRYPLQEWRFEKKWCQCGNKV